jgi:hypothetical protein
MVGGKSTDAAGKGVAAAHTAEANKCSRIYEGGGVSA